MKLVYVEWLDSYGVSSSWVDVEAMQKVPDLTCKSVGWLIADTATYIVVCPHLTQNDHAAAKYTGCGEMAIPRVALVRLVDLSIPGDAPQAPSAPSSRDPGYVTWITTLPKPGLADAEWPKS